MLLQVVLISKKIVQTTLTPVFITAVLLLLLVMMVVMSLCAVRKSSDKMLMGIACTILWRIACVRLAIWGMHFVCADIWPIT